MDIFGPSLRFKCCIVFLSYDSFRLFQTLWILIKNLWLRVIIVIHAAIDIIITYLVFKMEMCCAIWMLDLTLNVVTHTEQRCRSASASSSFSSFSRHLRPSSCTDKDGGVFLI
jgi:hypothetical protein